MSIKFSDLSIDEIEFAIHLFEIAQARSGEDKILQAQIDELKDALKNRSGVLSEKVLLKE